VTGREVEAADLLEGSRRRSGGSRLRCSKRMGARIK
jgi:hypothetical protein